MLHIFNLQQMFLLRDKLIPQGEIRETSTKTCKEAMLPDKLRFFVSRISQPLGCSASKNSQLKLLQHLLGYWAKKTQTRAEIMFCFRIGLCPSKPLGGGSFKKFRRAPAFFSYQVTTLAGDNINHWERI